MPRQPCRESDPVRPLLANRPLPGKRPRGARVRVSQPVGRQRPRGARVGVAPPGGRQRPRDARVGVSQPVARQTPARRPRWRLPARRPSTPARRPRWRGPAGRSNRGGRSMSRTGARRPTGPGARPERTSQGAPRGTMSARMLMERTRRGRSRRPGDQPTAAAAVRASQAVGCSWSDHERGQDAGPGEIRRGGRNRRQPDTRARGPHRFAILRGGEVSEWLMVPLSKSGVRKHRGFESHPLRHSDPDPTAHVAPQPGPRRTDRGEVA